MKITKYAYRIKITGEQPDFKFKHIAMRKVGRNGNPSRAVKTLKKDTYYYITFEQ